MIRLPPRSPRTYPPFPYPTLFRSVVDRRPSGGQRHLALQTQLLRRLVAGIETSRRLQARGGGGVAVEPLGLHRLLVPLEAEPAQVVLDGPGEFRRRALGVGVVDAQQIAHAVGAGEQPVDTCLTRRTEA